MEELSRKQQTAKTLLRIPLWIGAVVIVCFVTASILERPTDKGVIYSLFAMSSIIGLFFAPLPCLVLSVIGTIKAAGTHMKRVARLGVIETICWIGVFVISMILFMRGMSI